MILQENAAINPLEIECWKVDRVLANQPLSSTASLLTSNIPFAWFLLKELYVETLMAGLFYNMKEMEGSKKKEDTTIN